MLQKYKMAEGWKLWGQRLLWRVWIASSAITTRWRKRRIIRIGWKQKSTASFV